MTARRRLLSALAAVAVAVVVLGGAPVTPALARPGKRAAEPPPPPTPLTIADLGWPADTQSVEVTSTAHVLREPHRKASPHGKVVDGTRAAWRQVVATGDKRCPRWIELEPRGWLCLAKVAPSALPPSAIAQPIVSGRSLVPGTYYDVGQGGTIAYESTDDLREGVGVELSTLVMVRSRGEVEIDGVAYQRTNKGLVPSGDLRELAPSPWAGRDLRAAPPPSWPFAFAFTGKRWGEIKVRAAPDRKAAVIATRQPRDVVALGAEQDGFVEIEPGGWVARADLRRAAPSPLPAGVGPDAPWIDVDLDEQVLVAYRGTTPEFVTLVSSGIRKGTTKVGTYQVRSMAATMRMAAEVWESKQYDVGEVPWAIRFRKGLFLHAAYWHDAFGARQSHGCVNLSPKDARFLYEWAALVPEGWSEVEIDRGAGIVVRIRDAAHPDPPVYGYPDERTP